MIGSGPNLIVASPTNNGRVAMPRVERETLLDRISELQLTLRHTRSEDLREVLEQTLADCIIRLAELDELLGIETA